MKPPIAISPSTEELRLEAAMLVYGGRYVTLHDIDRPLKGAPRLGPGRPIGRGELAKLLAAAGRESAMSGWVDPRVLFVGPELLVWHTPPQQRPMFFRCTDPKAGRLRDCAGTAPQPSLVWAVSGDRWYVWATQLGDLRPGPESDLYQAPYLNVYDDGGICTGNAAVPRHLSAESIDGYERAFYESRFTHPNARHLTTRTESIYALWNSLLVDHAGPFPDDALMPLNKTLGDVVRRLTQEATR
jgi:PRTRC genetic system protein B